MAKGCLLGLIALVSSLYLVLGPIQGIFNYMGWPVFNGAGLHAGTWIIAWPLVFGIGYFLLLWIDRLWRQRSKHPDRQK
jgi:uncharacterized membrane protein